ncbi:hypothetical protein NHF53_21685, partial [Ciceribacter sp. RN22]|nr:hypothetical protein [Ciceribacter sp. RN22]
SLYSRLNFLRCIPSLQFHWKHLNSVSMKPAAGHIAIAVGAPTSSEQFENNLRSCSQAAFEQGGQDDLLLLYWLVPRTAEAYDFIDIFRRQHRPLPGLVPLLLR